MSLLFSSVQPRDCCQAIFLTNFSVHWIRPVICMTTNSVRIAPIVIASPVNPSKKNAYENRTRVNQLRQPRLHHRET